MHHGGARLRLFVASATLTTLAFAGGNALAQGDREQCVASAEQAQQLRDDGKYRRAREQMLSCSREVCPSQIKSDCGRWLTEIDRDAPTVVFGARDTKGNDVLDVKVSMDGAPLVERLDGKPMLVDSGEHVFKFESKDGTVKEERVLLRAAEKARPIIAQLGGGAADGGQTSARPAGADGSSTEPGKEGSIVPSLVLGGIGVLAIGSFATFGIIGKSDVDDLQSCKPNCKQADVDSARTKLIIADVSLVVGVLALGGAAVLFFTRSKPDVKVHTGAAPPRPASPLASVRQTLRLSGGPIAGGGGVFGLGAKF